MQQAGAWIVLVCAFAALFFSANACETISNLGTGLPSPTLSSVKMGQSFTLTQSCSISKLTLFTARRVTCVQGTYWLNAVNRDGSVGREIASEFVASTDSLVWDIGNSIGPLALTAGEYIFSVKFDVGQTLCGLQILNDPTDTYPLGKPYIFDNPSADRELKFQVEYGASSAILNPLDIYQGSTPTCSFVLSKSTFNCDDAGTVSEVRLTNGQKSCTTLVAVKKTAFVCTADRETNVFNQERPSAPPKDSPRRQ